jgi:hypothetical protein
MYPSQTLSLALRKPEKPAGSGKPARAPCAGHFSPIFFAFFSLFFEFVLVFFLNLW